MQNETGNRNTAPAPNLEPVVSDAPLAAETVQRFTSPVCIHVHSIRKRLADVDGISAKAVIDGIVKAGLLDADTTEQIREVTFSQEKGHPERTIITVSDE